MTGFIGKAVDVSDLKIEINYDGDVISLLLGSVTLEMSSYETRRLSKRLNEARLDLEKFKRNT